VKEKEKPIIAAAIEYDAKRDNAPRMTAKGRGHIAEKIIALARKHNIPVKEDPVLVDLLSRLDIDEHIPPELYQAVAEVLAFVYSLNAEYPNPPLPQQDEENFSR